MGAPVTTLTKKQQLTGTLAVGHSSSTSTEQLDCLYTTLDRCIFFEGTGVHTGRPVHVELRPQIQPNGLRFIRTDLENNPIVMARWDKVEQQAFCTCIKNDQGVQVKTIEHLMAALFGLGVNNLDILIDGPEVPIMDGSSQCFTAMIEPSFVKNLGYLYPVLKIVKEKVEYLFSFHQFENRLEKGFKFS